METFFKNLLVALLQSKLTIILRSALKIMEKVLNPVTTRRFFRCSTDLNKIEGLGLYLIKEAVEKLGGVIQVTSEKGKGSSSKVTMPCKYSFTQPVA